HRSQEQLDLTAETRRVRDGRPIWCDRDGRKIQPAEPFCRRERHEEMCGFGTVRWRSPIRGDRRADQNADCQNTGCRQDPLREGCSYACRHWRSGGDWLAKHILEFYSSIADIAQSTFRIAA